MAVSKESQLKVDDPLHTQFPNQFLDIWENPLADRKRLAEFWEDHLFSHLLPFWEKYAFDEQGGLNTMLADDGTLLGTDKWLWGQFRAIWVFSKIYNTLDPDPRWLKYAEHIYRFTTAHGWDNAGDGWALCLSQTGEIITGAESIYTDAFALAGLTEYARALDVTDGELALLVKKTANAVLRKLEWPHDRIPHAPYPVPPGARVHCCQQPSLDSTGACRSSRSRPGTPSRRRSPRAQGSRPRCAPSRTGNR